MWETLVSYPQYVPDRTARLLSEAEALFGPPRDVSSDRVVTLTAWLRELPLTFAEWHTALSDIGPHL